jgi:hypothetical protein
MSEIDGTDEFEKLTNVEVTKAYLTARRNFRSLADRANRISRGSGSIPSTGNRMFWASVLFTRTVVTANSILRLLPDTKPGEHWDFSAVASISRNLGEASLVYHWLCGNDMLEDVREGRFILLYLHDRASRRRLFPSQFPAEDPVFEDLVKRFDENSYLKTFDERQRKVALKGEKTPFIHSG